MALDLIGRQFREQNRGEGGDGGGGAENREPPSAVNARGNARRLAMIEQVGRTADGKRADELQDTDGREVTGRFDGGSFDDSPEAREKAALREEDEAEQARQEQAERARLAEEQESDEERRARELQEEGTGDGTQRGRQSQDEGTQAGDEKVIGGVRHYLTIVDGNEKWLTLRQLREHAAVVINTEETLQRAQDALQRSSRSADTPKDPPEEISEKDLETIILSASVGEEEAVRKLASILAKRPQGVDTQAIGRQVAQQIATQRAVDEAKSEQKDLIGHAVLAPIFDQRLVAFAKERPKTSIKDAYKAVGEQMRKDFAPLLTGRQTPPEDKTQRKRTIVTPPQGVARQRTTEADDREPSVSSDIDAIAKSRGQVRAHRESRRS